MSLVATVFTGSARATDRAAPDGDRDADGKTDIGVVRKDPDNHAYLWYWNGSAGVDSVEAWGDPTINDIPVPGDYDGDGITDAAVYRRGSPGAFWVHRSSDGGTTIVPWGEASQFDIPWLTGDYDGDGKADYAVMRPQRPNTWFIHLSGGGDRVVPWGSDDLGDVPVPADYDGDGITDIAISRPDPMDLHRVFWILGSRDGFYQVHWGQSIDIIVPGDFDGDGRADFAAARPPGPGGGPVHWFLLQSTAGYRTLLWGNAGDDIPTSGDFDGDGRSDIAIARLSPSPNEFWVEQSSNGQLLYREWGEPEDAPIDRFYVLRSIL